MRSTMATTAVMAVVAAVALLAGCAAGGPAMVGGRSDARVVGNAFLRLDLGDAVYHCRLPGSTLPYPKCDDDIPVFVLLRDTPIGGVDCTPVEAPALSKPTASVPRTTCRPRRHMPRRSRRAAAKGASVGVAAAAAIRSASP